MIEIDLSLAFTLYLLLVLAIFFSSGLTRKGRKGLRA